MRKAANIIIDGLIALILGIIVGLSLTKIPLHPASRAISIEPALTQVFDDPGRGVRVYYYDTAGPEIPTDTPTSTELPPTATFTKTVTRTPTRTPSQTGTATKSAPGALNYYLVDRVPNNADFAILAGWGINTAVVSFDVNGSSTTWRGKFQAAQSAGVNIVIWPSDWTHPRTNCNWEAPYPVSATGDISHVTNLLDVAVQYPNFIGIVSAQEALWPNCPMTFDEMAGLKEQLKAYATSKGRPDVKVWNYIDNLYDEAKLPAAQIPRIMDVAVTWQHCAGNAEGTCSAALTATRSDVERAKAAGVELVWLVQTFTTSAPYNVKFTLGDLESWSCQFISTGLQGFGYYTWGADWWPDLREWQDVQPAIAYVPSTCGKTNPPITATPSRTPTATQERTATWTPIIPTYTITQTPSATSIISPSPTPPMGGFTFVSMGDAQGQTSASNTFFAINGIKPDFLIFNGDLENDGVTTTEMNREVGYLKTYSLFNNGFIVRGNHDNHVTGSAGLWENYFSTTPNIKTLPAGVSNYVSLNSSSDYLTYSFDYGNSRFIGLDVPGDFSAMTSAQFTWLDQRLTDAESLGLTHAFLFWHGPEYCVESIHCSTSTRTGTISTNMAKLVTIINAHPIVSATFHGHEHILGWVHMDNTRVSTITHPWEEFFTSPSSGYLSYYSDLFPARVDYAYPLGTGASDTCFALVSVNGASFTVSLYKTGTAAPVWSRTFTK